MIPSLMAREEKDMIFNEIMKFMSCGSELYDDLSRKFDRAEDFIEYQKETDDVYRKFFDKMIQYQDDKFFYNVMVNFIYQMFLSKSRFQSRNDKFSNYFKFMIVILNESLHDLVWDKTGFNYLLTCLVKLYVFNSQKQEFINIRLIKNSLKIMGVIS